MPNVVFNLSLFLGLFLPIHSNDLMIARNLFLNVLSGMPLLLKRFDFVLNYDTLTLPINCFIDAVESFFSPLLLENKSQTIIFAYKQDAGSNNDILIVN